MSDSRVPSWGQAASIVDTGTEAFQVWFGLQAPLTPGGQTESPASATAGKVPGAVYPPVEAEYSVVSGDAVPAASIT